MNGQEKQKDWWDSLLTAGTISAPAPPIMPQPSMPLEKFPKPEKPEKDAWDLLPISGIVGKEEPEKPKKPSILKKVGREIWRGVEPVVGLGESLITTISSMAAYPIAVAGGQLAKSFGGKTWQEAKETKGKIAEFLTHEPLTESGQVYSEILGSPFALAGKGIEAVTGAIAPESPETQAMLGSAVDIALLASPGLKRLMTKTKALPAPAEAMTRAEKVGLLPLGEKKFQVPQTRPPISPEMAPPLETVMTKSEVKIPIFKKEIDPYVLGQRKDLGLGKTKLGENLKLAIENPYRIFEGYPELKPLMDGYNVALKEIQQKDRMVGGLVREWRQRPGITKESGKKIGAYLTSLEKNGLELLKETGQDRWLRPLNPDEIKITNEVRSYWDKYHGAINNARTLTGEKPMKYEKNYFPWMRNFGLLERAGISPLTDSPAVLEYHLAGVPFKFAKTRRGKSPIPIELDFFNVFDNYSRKANKVISLAPIIAKARGLTSDLVVPKSIEAAKKTGPEWQTRKTTWNMGDDYPELKNYIRDWADTIAGKKFGSTNRYLRLLEPYARVLAKNTAVATLGINFRTAITQPTAIGLAYKNLGEKYLIQGVWEDLFRPEKVRFAEEWSNVLGPRQMDYTLGLALEPRTAVKKLGQKYERFRRQAATISTATMRGADAETARATWLGAYAKATDGMKLYHYDAIDFADKVVLDTQASGQLGHIAPIQRGDIGAALSVFNTYTINQWNELSKNVLGIRNPTMKTGDVLKNLARLGVATAVINSIFERGLGLQSPMPAPEIEIQRQIEGGETNIPKMGLAAAKEMAELLPIIGGTIRWSTPNRTPMPATAQVVADLFRTTAKLTQLDFSKINLRDFEAILKTAGIPGTSQVMKYYARRKAGMGHVEAIVGKRMDTKGTSGTSYYLPEK